MGRIPSQMIDEINGLKAQETEVLAAPSWAGSPDTDNPGEQLDFVLTWRHFSMLELLLILPPNSCISPFQQFQRCSLV